MMDQLKLEAVMALIFDPAFENTALKNQSLLQEIEGLKRFITPDNELLDGQDMIGYRLEREKASIEEIEAMLKNETYKKAENSELENNQIKAELLAQINEHKADIIRLEQQREEIPKAIARLERLHLAQLRDVGVLKLSANTSRDDIKKMLKEIEARVQAASQEEKRVLTYLQGQLETAKTMLDTGKPLADVYLYVHESEFRHLGKLPGLKQVHLDVTKHMLENILTDLRTEEVRLRDKGSPLHQHFAQPIAKVENRLEEMNRNPQSITDKRKMLETMTVVDKLSMDLQAEKTVAPTFKDRLRNFVNNFRSFLSNTFGIKTQEPESLRSKTMTNMYKTQQEVAKMAKFASQSKHVDRENPKPRI